MNIAAAVQTPRDIVDTQYLGKRIIRYDFDKSVTFGTTLKDEDAIATGSIGPAYPTLSAVIDALSAAKRTAAVVQVSEHAFVPVGIPSGERTMLAEFSDTVVGHYVPTKFYTYGDNVVAVHDARRGVLENGGAMTPMKRIFND